MEQSNGGKPSGERVNREESPAKQLSCRNGVHCSKRQKIPFSKNTTQNEEKKGYSILINRNAFSTHHQLLMAEEFG
jgi:hypothetical protein